MKHIYTIMLACTLALPANMVANKAQDAYWEQTVEQENDSWVQEVVASIVQESVTDIFKQHKNDHTRLKALRDLIENSLHNHDHNWFQRAANMTAQEEQELTQEYANHRAAYEVSMEPIRKAIKFLEDKLAFETNQLQVDKEEREKQAKIEERQAQKYLLVFCAAIGTLTWLAVECGIQF